MLIRMLGLKGRGRILLLWVIRIGGVLKRLILYMGRVLSLLILWGRRTWWMIGLWRVIAVREAVRILLLNIRRRCCGLNCSSRAG